MKHESNRPLSSRPISAIFVRPQGFMEYSNVTWSPGEWQQMKAAIKWNHGQVRLVPSLIPRVSLFQLVGTWLVYSFHPGTQVPVEPNFVSLSLSSGDILWHPKTTQRSSQHILCIFQLTELKKEEGFLKRSWLIPSIREHKFWSSQICCWTFVSLSLSSGDIFLASKNDKTQLTHLKLLDRKTFFILQWT